MIEIEPAENGRITDIIRENKTRADDSHVKYENGIRYSADVKETAVSGGKIRIPWNDGGIYLITGGAGGLGFIFAKEIARKVKEPTLVLTGRSALSENQRMRSQSLESLGAKAEYKQADVTNAQTAADLVKTIETEYGGLHGIIHSAGVMKDQYIAKKTTEEFYSVLAPKTDGFVNLDEATEHLALDFFYRFLIHFRRHRECGTGGLCGGKRIYGQLCGIPQRTGYRNVPPRSHIVGQLAALEKRRNASQ